MTLMATQSAILVIWMGTMVCGLRSSSAQDANVVAGADANAEQLRAEAEHRAMLDRVRAAWDRQSMIFRNAQYTATYATAGDPPTTQEYLTDREGRFRVKEVSCNPEGFTFTTVWGFDGQANWYYQTRRGPDSRIISDSASIDATKVIANPGDCLFWRPPATVFDRPSGVQISRTDKGLWDINDGEYRVTVDPDRDFAITRLSWGDNTTRYTRFQYEKTGEGFWYPRRVEVDCGSRHASISVLRLDLNVRDISLDIDIPKGTWVSDDRVDTRFPDVYMFGVPRKSAKQIASGYGRFVAGTAVDEQGRPVAGVHVKVIHCKPQAGAGGWEGLRSGSSLMAAARNALGIQASEPERDVTQTWTDGQGRFAIEVRMAGLYTLLFSPKDQAPTLAYDVPMATRDLRVVLPAGGTVAGRIVRFTGTGKVPVANAQVAIEHTCDVLGPEHNQTTITDQDGRFLFEHLCTLARADLSKAGLVPIVWDISHGGTSRTVAFSDGNTVADVEVVIPADPAEMPSLIGRPLPGLASIQIDWPQDQAGEHPVLACLFDMRSQPSRNTMLGLSLKAPSLEQKGIHILAVQMSGADPNELRSWLKEICIGFPVGIATSQDAEVRYTWGARSLPWLVLTDRQHIVRAEGLTVGELDAHLDRIEAHCGAGRGEPNGGMGEAANGRGPGDRLGGNP